MDGNNVWGYVITSRSNNLIIDGTPYAVKVARTVWTYTKSERIVRDGIVVTNDSELQAALTANEEFIVLDNASVPFSSFAITNDNTTIKTDNATISVSNVAGYDVAGIVVDAVNVTIDGVTIEGTGTKSGVLGIAGSEFTVMNSTITNVGTGIFANGSYPAVGRVELSASNNVIENFVAGIGGTENTDLKLVTNNSFTTGTEGIGLGTGVTLSGVTDVDTNFVDYLVNNNSFTGVTTTVEDWR